MKRKLAKNGKGKGPPQHMQQQQQHYGGWQPRGRSNMRGGGGRGFRGSKRGTWRGPRGPKIPRYFLEKRGRGGPSGYPSGYPSGFPYNNPQQYPYNNPQQYIQNPQWLQQQFPHDCQQYQSFENEDFEIDASQGEGGCASGGSCVQSGGNVENWTQTNVNNTSGSENSGNSANDTNNSTSNVQVEMIVEESNKKAKVKRRLSKNYFSKPWNKEDAEKALAVETAHMKRMKTGNLVIRFPDPELTKDIVKNFHSGIENVHFQVPGMPRYCFVQLAENVNPDETIKELSKSEFGSGKLVVEKRSSEEEEEQILNLEAIDPYTLYIGNIPRNVKVANVKKKFPTASKVDVGFAQRMKCTRYAFIGYKSVDDAIEAFKSSHDLLIESRSLIVRFRRLRGPAGLPGKPLQQKPSEEESVVQNVSSCPQNEDEVVKVSATDTVPTKVVKKTLIIHFPDPLITTDMVKNFHPGIENVHFHTSCAPRYCIVNLVENADPDEVMKELSQIQFGGGKLMVERQVVKEGVEPGDPST